MAKIPNWLFAAFLAAVFGAGVLITLKYPFMQRFQNPDTALAWLACLFASSLFFQQTTNYSHGFMYMLSSRKTRRSLDNKQENPKGKTKPVVAKGRWGVVLKSGYWVSVVIGLLLFASLLLGTLREPSSKDIQMLTQRLDTIVEQNNEMLRRNDVQRMIDSNQQLVERIDRLLEQNAEVLRRLEARDVPRTDTPTK